MSKQSLNLSIVIPLYNEEPSLQPLAAELKVVLEPLGRPYEINIFST